MVLAFSLPDFPNLLQNPWQLALTALVTLGGATVGAIVLSFGVRALCVTLWKDLSSSAIFRLRLLGGLAGAVIAFSYLGSGGGGFGFGPGPGGLPGGRGEGESRPQPLTNPQTTSPSKPASAPSPRSILKVGMLGAKTSPPYEYPNGLFAIIGDPADKVLTIDQVIERIRLRKQQEALEAVQLVANAESSVLGMSLIKPLRERILKEIRVPFLQPNFEAENPFEAEPVRFSPEPNK